MKMTTTAKHQHNVIKNIKQIKPPPPLRLSRLILFHLWYFYISRCVLFQLRRIIQINNLFMKLYFAVDEYLPDSVIAIIITISSNKRFWFKENLRCVLFLNRTIYLCITACRSEEHVENRTPLIRKQPIIC